MTFVIDCYDRKTGNHTHTLHKDFREFSEWLERAFDRRFRVERSQMFENMIYVDPSDDSEKYRFEVYTAD